jgi:hypothetical protein
MDEAGLERPAALLRIDLRGTDGFGMLIGISRGPMTTTTLVGCHPLHPQIPTRTPKMWHELEVLLAYGGSMWAATSGDFSGSRATATEVFNAATAASDSAVITLHWHGQRIRPEPPSSFRMAPLHQGARSKPSVIVCPYRSWRRCHSSSTSSRLGGGISNSEGKPAITRSIHSSRCLNSFGQTPTVWIPRPRVTSDKGRGGRSRSACGDDRAVGA